MSFKRDFDSDPEPDSDPDSDPDSEPDSDPEPDPLLSFLSPKFADFIHDEKTQLNIYK
jgi:hypothetical protein